MGARTRSEQNKRRKAWLSVFVLCVSPNWTLKL
jgi:hypothetical protein